VLKANWSNDVIGTDGQTTGMVEPTAPNADSSITSQSVTSSE
jgi:hypothetical protein